MVTSSQTSSLIQRTLNALHRCVCHIVRFVMVKLYGKHGESVPPIDDRLLLQSATSIAEKIRTKEITAVQVMTAFIRRIEQINPLLNCVVDERFKDALDDAARVDELVASNKYSIDELRESKPFLGVPLSTKDSVGIKDMIQSCGLWLRRHECATEDSDVIRLMREAGAIPFVITNVPEMCMWWESANTIYGRCNNPYDTNRTVGGSSGGEGCLLAAGGSPIGIGSDIGGSIRMPAFFNGIFGHKPSPFTVPIDGVWPKVTGDAKLFALALGPMCRYACDLRPMLKVLTGDKANDILRLDDPVDLSSLRYFYQMNDGGGSAVLPVDCDIRSGMESVMNHIENELGVQPKSVRLESLKNSIPLWLANLLDDDDIPFECKLANFNGQINPYAELLKQIFGLSNHTLPALLFALKMKISTQYGSMEHRSLIKERDDLLQEFKDMLGDDGVFIYPTHPTVAPYHSEALIKANNCGYTGIFSVLGLPCTAIPLGIGQTERLPVGIQVVANRNQDRLCLAVASELERVFGGWVPPKD